MLKRLLSRDISSKVAFRAKKSVTSDEADGVSLPETEGLTTPAPTPKTPTPELKTPDPSLRRRSTSMRASDVIDEHGRSAEQLAAEAALEFDIMAVARRVNEEGEAGGGATVTTLNPGPVARPKVEAGPRLCPRSPCMPRNPFLPVLKLKTVISFTPVPIMVLRKRR